MVRRWSYINHINNIHPQSSRVYAIEASAKDAILNVIMYLRCDFPFSSKSFRKNWTRRKYANQKLFLTNVMINWAKEYRFYKNYNRMLHYQFLFKNTYLSVNLLINRSYSSEKTKFDVAVVGSSITRRLMTFFTKRFFCTRFSNLLYWPNTSWSYASYDQVFNDNDTTHSNAPYTPMYHLTFKDNTYVPVVYDDVLVERGITLKNISNLFFRFLQHQLICNYKIMIKMLFYILFKSLN
jgi:hypothetical protein